MMALRNRGDYPSERNLEIQICRILPRKQERIYNTYSDQMVCLPGILKIRCTPTGVNLNVNTFILNLGVVVESFCCYSVGKVFTCLCSFPEYLFCYITNYERFFEGDPIPIRAICSCALSTRPEFS